MRATLLATSSPRTNPTRSDKAYRIEGIDLAAAAPT
jgi:hypothetical protein